MLIVTVFLVSVAVFAITESSPGNIAKNVLGAFITPEQEASFLAQMGLDKPAYLRFIFWLAGSDWYAGHRSGFEFKRVSTHRALMSGGPWMRKTVWFAGSWKAKTWWPWCANPMGR